MRCLERQQSIEEVSVDYSLHALWRSCSVRIQIGGLTWPEGTRQNDRRGIIVTINFATFATLVVVEEMPSEACNREEDEKYWEGN